MKFRPGTQLRDWSFRVHTWCGLALGLYALVIGLSGAALVWQEELEAAEYPQFQSAMGREISTSPDQALAAVRQAFPEDRPISLTWPNQDTPYWMSYVLLKAGAREVYVDPGSGLVTGVRDPSAGWVGWLGRVHTNLLAGAVGRRINTYAACALLGLCLTGPILWWPPNGAFRGRWRLDWSAGWWKFFWQAHNIVGAAAVLFIALLSFTGTYFYWSSSYVGAVSAVFARTKEPSIGAVAPGASMLNMQQFERASLDAYPGVPIHRVSVQDSPTFAVRVTYREAAPEEFHLVTTVFLHPVTGAVLGRNVLAQRPMGDTILTWFSALHFGVFGGWPVKLLWSILSLSLPILGISGFWIWWGRLKRAQRGSAERDETDARVLQA